ncbi:hypothetical protein niasHT_012296 [Heterodera trifolii]|uniref:Uncharacterized protein n=1 Tax=Heterodera trifolii TaxID=157864 RepID=A0ABD2LES3_9BILA
MSPNKFALLLLLLISFNISVANGCESPFSELKKFFETALSLVAEKAKEAVELVKCTFWNDACKKLCDEKLRPCHDQQKDCYSTCGNTKQKCDEACTKCSDREAPAECKDEFGEVCFLSGHQMAYKDRQEEACCKEVKRQCDGERDACYSVCGNKQEHCSSVHEKCFKKRDRVDCHGVGKLGQVTDMAQYVGMQTIACMQQKKTFKQIPSDELEKPENGQLEKSVGNNSSDVPPNATTTALTAVPMP